MFFGISLVLFIFCTLSTNVSSFSLKHEWIVFKSQHNPSYGNTTHDEKRMDIFEENLAKIDNHNQLYEQGLKPYKLGVTKFADLTPNEFQEMLNLKVDERRVGKKLFEMLNIIDEPVPESIDWRTKGAVSHVKNQGICGSCWAFSATGAIESQYFLKTGHLVALSEQQLIDCGPGENGCNGGYIDKAFEYAKDIGLEAESNYPYKMSENTCNINNSLPIARIKDYVDIRKGDEKALLAAVGLIGPVSVAVDARGFQLYKEGIYHNEHCSQTRVNHGVLIVGYGSKNGMDYWIVKNSWGRDFGENGYVLMKRGVNECGIALYPSYPVM